MPRQVLVEGPEILRGDPAAGGADGLALQGAADQVDAADFRGAQRADDRTSVGPHLHDTDARQDHQRLPDRHRAHAEPLGQRLDDQPLAGAEPALEDLLEQAIDDRLATQAVPADLGLTV
jgi:hypothetical protein